MTLSTKSPIPSSPSPSPPPPLPNPTTTTSSFDPYFDNACIVDIHHFTTTLSNIKSKNLRPDLLPSIIAHYASKWLPELSSSTTTTSSSHVSSTSAWLEKRILVENLVNILPKEKEAMPSTFLLRLLRTASMVGVGAVYLDEIENRVASQLERASLEEVMIPGFGHTCKTLLDVGLMVRLVSKFLRMEGAMGSRSGAEMVKVAKLVDSYLAEVAMDGELLVAEFERLATAMPSHSRATDDGLYRAVDTYIKAHPNTTKQEKKALSRLIDPRKLSLEASLHAIHNDRLPVRSVIQILFSEQSRLNNRIGDWSLGSFSGPRSPNPVLEGPCRCLSKREVLAQHHEMRKLKEDVARLQTQCRALQAQTDKLSPEKKQKKKGLLRWTSFLSRNSDPVVDMSVDEYEIGHVHRTPKTTLMDVKKAKMINGTPRWRRNSMS